MGLRDHPHVRAGSPRRRPRARSICAALGRSATGPRGVTGCSTSSVPRSRCARCAAPLRAPRRRASPSSRRSSRTPRARASRRAGTPRARRESRLCGCLNDSPSRRTSLASFQSIDTTSTTSTTCASAAVARPCVSRWMRGPRPRSASASARTTSGCSSGSPPVIDDEGVALELERRCRLDDRLDRQRDSRASRMLVRRRARPGRDTSPRRARYAASRTSGSAGRRRRAARRASTRPRAAPRPAPTRRPRRNFR